MTNCSATTELITEQAARRNPELAPYVGHTLTTYGITADHIAANCPTCTR